MLTNIIKAAFIILLVHKIVYEMCLTLGASVKTPEMSTFYTQEGTEYAQLMHTLYTTSKKNLVVLKVAYSTPLEFYGRP